MTAQLILKAGREKSLKRRHPWVFSGAVARVEGGPGLGDTVEVLSAQGERMGCAAYSPQSSIRARMWAFGEEDCSDMRSFSTEKMRIAIYKRIHNHLFDTHNNGIRLIHAESDGLPGLVVDQYDNWLVAQFLTAGAEKWKPVIVDALAEITGLGNIYERSDADVRALEGLEEVTGLLKGDAPPGEVTITENYLRYRVDIQKGHKTGFYLDQRDNRQIVANYAKDRRCVELFFLHGRLCCFLFSQRRFASGVNRFIGGCAGAGQAQPGIERAAGGQSRMAVRGCLSRAACHARPARILRPDHPGPAQVRPYRGPGAGGRARLQGHQPAGL